jgi:hypothetical protein
MTMWVIEGSKRTAAWPEMVVRGVDDIMDVEVRPVNVLLG